MQQVNNIKNQNWKYFQDTLYYFPTISIFCIHWPHLYGVMHLKHGHTFKTWIWGNNQIGIFSTEFRKKKYDMKYLYETCCRKKAMFWNENDFQKKTFRQCIELGKYNISYSFPN